MKKAITHAIHKHQQAIEHLLAAEIDNIETISKSIVAAFQGGHKLLIFGNGGSAADAQHIAAEFISRLNFDRPALPAIALTTNTSSISAISNDSSFSHVFERQVDALGSQGDIALAITTSDVSSEINTHSANLTFALAAARRKKMLCIGLLSSRGHQIRSLVDQAIIVNAEETTRVQECHILAAHIICEIVEETLFADQSSVKR